MSSGADNLEADEAEARKMCCAACGIAELDDVKLMDCDGCKSVRYCGDACKKDHWPEHEAKCKDRAAELRDEILFRQPESTHQGDCPICCVPLPIENGKSALFPCCSKVICDGCAYADNVRQRREKTQITCPFCRHPLPKTDEEGNKIMMKRVEANDPAALGEMGGRNFDEGNYYGAFEYWMKAAELGDKMAHYNLSLLYSKGRGVEKDETKKIFHLEEAAIQGNPYARHNLANHEHEDGRFDRAVKHLIIAASLGYDRSIKLLKEYYKHGYVSKDDFAASLRAHKAAVDATKSPQRGIAENVPRWC